MIKNTLYFTLSGIVLAAFFSCGKADLSSEKAKYSYSIGHQIANNIKRQGLELDLLAFGQALKDVMEGKETSLSKQEMQMAMGKMSAMIMKKRRAKSSINTKVGEEYLKKNIEKKGVIVTQSGLHYRVIKAGRGPKPRKTNTVMVHYRGKLIDGTEFDSSYKRNKPAQFALNRVIPGWTEGIQLMSVGSKYEFTIPSNLAYGEMGNSNIPGNSVLIFEVELLSIIK